MDKWLVNYTLNGSCYQEIVYAKSDMDYLDAAKNVMDRVKACNANITDLTTQKA